VQVAPTQAAGRQPAGANPPPSLEGAAVNANQGLISLAHLLYSSTPLFFFKPIVNARRHGPFE
jgi:hypothetical protein